MCSRTTCRNCKKPTWSGCGQHIEIALKGVPRKDRCSCTKEELQKASSGGFLSKIFGKR